MGPGWLGGAAPAVSLLVFLVLTASIYLVATRSEVEPATHDPSAGVRRDEM